MAHAVEFDENTPEIYCKRVMAGKRSHNAWGNGTFLPHSELQPKYLKNDCIKLCIKKVVLF